MHCVSCQYQTVFHYEHKSCLFIVLTVLTCKYCVHSVGVGYMVFVFLRYVHKLSVSYVLYNIIRYVICCGYSEGCTTSYVNLCYRYGYSLVTC